MSFHLRKRGSAAILPLSRFIRGLRGRVGGGLEARVKTRGWVGTSLGRWGVHTTGDNTPLLLHTFLRRGVFLLSY